MHLFYEKVVQKTNKSLYIIFLVVQIEIETHLEKIEYTDKSLFFIFFVFLKAIFQNLHSFTESFFILIFYHYG